MSITLYGAMGLGQISLDHPSGVDWINQRNLDMRVISDLVAVYPFTSTAIPYADATGKLTQTVSQLAWDSVNKIFTVGSSANGVATISQTISGLALLMGSMGSSGNPYGFGIKFSSTDPQFTTVNPKFLAGIFPRATQDYTLDTAGGMGIDFFYSANNPGASPTPQRGFTLDSTGLNLDTNTPLVLTTPTTLAIAAGVIAVTGSYHIIDTQGAASSDDLDTISGGTVGQLLILRILTSARVITLIDSAVLALAGNCTLATASSTIMLLKITDTIWVEITRSLN